MITFDQATVDSSGAFLIGELERLDQTLNLPLVGYTWTRDIQLREDVSIADDISSWTNTSFGAAGTGANPNGKNWVGKDSTAIAGVNVDISKRRQSTEPLGHGTGLDRCRAGSSSAGRSPD